MRRRCFFSFHYSLDAWRAAQVRNMGLVKGNKPVTANAWEEVKKGGDHAIKLWIDGQMAGRSCAVVLIGSQTAGRPWVKYEIKKAWNEGLGVVGIRIHGLQNEDGKISHLGKNPLGTFKIRHNGRFGTAQVKFLSSVVKCYSPAGRNSKERYAWISKNLANAVAEAIEIREQFTSWRIS